MGCRLPNSEAQSQIVELLAIARAVVSKPLFGHDRRWCVLGAHGTLWRKGQVGVRYQIKPIERVEADLADVRICNEYDELVVTFTLPDIYEACIARELMIRALAKAVLITSHTSVVRENRNSAEEVITELNRLSSQGNEGAPRLPPPEKR